MHREYRGSREEIAHKGQSQRSHRSRNQPRTHSARDYLPRTNPLQKVDYRSRTVHTAVQPAQSPPKKRKQLQWTGQEIAQRRISREFSTVETMYTALVTLFATKFSANTGRLNPHNSTRLPCNNGWICCQASTVVVQPRVTSLEAIESHRSNQ